MIDNLKNIITSYWDYLPIKTACKLNLFDKILNNENTVSILCENYRYDKKTLDLVLSYLIHSGFISTKNSCFQLTEKGQILTENHPKSLKYACIVWAEEHLTAWQNLEYTLKTGKPAFDKIYGQNFFNYIANKPDKLKIYHRAMAEYARDDYENICNVIDFTKHKNIIDVGGGIGTLTQIINKHLKKNTCYTFDKQEVIKISDFSSKIKISGDFFKEIPNFADAIIVSRILHDWNNEKASIILKNIHSALPVKGTLYVIENFSDKIPDNASILSLNMAIMTNSFERSEKQYTTLLQQNNFTIKKIKKLNNLQRIITCKKQNK